MAVQIWCPYLVGREAELRALRDQLALARGGRGGVVVVSGEAGVGQSRLARELAGIARADGVTVLTGRAVEALEQVAYRPVAEVVAQALRDRPVADDPELATWRPALRVMVPLRGCVPDAPDEVVARVQATAEGIPLLVEEVLATVRANAATGPARRAIEQVGRRVLEDTLRTAFESAQQPDGTIRHENAFRYVIATA